MTDQQPVSRKSSSPKNPPAAKADGFSSTHIWMITIGAVVVILLMAVMFSVMMQKQKEVSGTGIAAQPAAVEQRAQAPVATPAPVTEVAPVKPLTPAREQKAERVTEAAPPAPAVAEPLVTSARDRRRNRNAQAQPLRLDGLPGTLRVQTTATPRENRLDFRHTCFRQGASLPVSWSGAPSRTKTYVVLLEEHKADKPVTVNWVVYNIPASAKGLPAGLPRAALFEGGIRQGMNDQEFVGYSAPCEAKGRVNYVLRLLALDTELNVPANTKFAAMVGMIDGHLVDAAEYKFVHYMQE